MPSSQNKLTRFFQELKRRKVFAVIVMYATTAFILLELAGMLEDSLNLPGWFDTVITVALIIGFPIAVVFSWIFDVSSKGIKKTEPEPEEAALPEFNKKVSRNSILVLPFENISSDSEQEYFSDGLTEEIITDLSHIRDLLVISRGSAMTFKGSKLTIKEIAEKVNVRYVLEGSVRKSENNLRIVAQLIDSSNDSHIWAEKYTGKLDDIFDIQENVSKSIVEELKIKLSTSEKKEIEKRSIDNVYAYDCYLKASQEFYKFSKEHLDKAVQLIQNGLQIVGENELLYETMGNVYIQMVTFAVSTDEDYLQKAKEWANKILAINENSSSGYYLNGIIKWRQGDWKAGVKVLFKSISLNPKNLNTLNFLVYTTSVAGKCELSRRFLPTLLEIDPLTPLFQGLPGWLEYMDGNFNNGIESLKKMYLMEPGNQVYGIYYAQFLTRMNKLDEAYRIIDKHAKSHLDDNMVKMGLIRMNCIQGKKDEALKYITPEVIDIVKGSEQFSWEFAANYALLGEKAEAINWLENAVNRGFINYPFLNEYDPLLENIRSEPHFKKLMKRVKREWENYET